EGLEEEYQHVLDRMNDPAVLADQHALRDAGRRFKELEPIVAAYRSYKAAHGDLEAAKEMAAESTGAERDEMWAEVEKAETEIARLDEELKVLLLPSDPNDGRAVIVEIRGAEGGEEANLFAKDLFDMYAAYAQRQGWKLEVLESSISDLGGFDAVTFRLVGDPAWSHMKHEGGPHRVQR